MSGFYLRILDNGEHDNFKILDYCEGITKIEEAADVVYLFTQSILSLSFLRQ